MQSTNMRSSFRYLHFSKTLNSHKPQTLTLFSKSPNFSQFPQKFHSQTPSNPLPPASWSPYLPPPPQTIYDPGTGSIVTTKEQSNPNPIAQNVENQPSNVDTRTRTYGEVIGSSSIRGRINKKGGKSRSVHVCDNCGYTDGQWWGTCKECGEVGTMKRFTVESGDERKGLSSTGAQVAQVGTESGVVRSWLPKQAGSGLVPVKLGDVCGRVDGLNWRIPLPGVFGAEVERVLGGGLVPGSLVLVGGDPGVGKSTLLLQLAALISKGKNDADVPARVMYVSGEESVEQIANRSDRLGIQTEELYLYSNTDIEEIIEQANRLSPSVVIIDSIQTAYLDGVTGSAGGPSQVKECTSALLRYAKRTNVPVLLIGHVTKSGDVAGPRVLEHIVDVVLYMEGEKSSAHRLLRSAKNRFGSTDELGVFQMSQSGLQGVSNPSEMFLTEQHSDSDYLAGLAVAVIMDGSRAFLIEIQALCVAGASGSASFVRHVNGVQNSRADMIISVIIKQAGLKLQENGIFLNVVSGFSLTETAGDLAVAAAICSSFLEFPLPNGIAFIGEIGLAGELRAVPQLERRVNTLAKLGYKKCIIPKCAEKSFSELQLQDMEIVGCNNLKEMINHVFKSS